MKTGAHLKIKSYGDAVLGVELEGNPKKPEPDHFRVYFPGGDVDITRTTDNEYWIHVHVNCKESTSYNPMEPTGFIKDARLDITDISASEANIGDFDNPNLYHLAFRVGRN
jgi:hypothetical protein